MIYDLRFKTLYPKPYTLNPKRGFSLVEVLVGAAVLIISVTGTLSIIAKNVSGAGIAQDRVAAFYLAQEAVEYVRSVRDNNAIADQPWLRGLESCMSPGTCTIDVTVPEESAVSSCSGECAKLFLDPSNGKYTQDDVGNTETIFTREVKITPHPTNPDREARVDATLKWKQGFVDRKFTISGHLFNWR